MSRTLKYGFTQRRKINWVKWDRRQKQNYGKFEEIVAPYGSDFGVCLGKIAARRRKIEAQFCG